MYCIDCGYLLNGVASHECPECGRNFSPGDNRTFASVRVRWDKKALDAVTRFVLRVAFALNLITCGIAFMFALIFLVNGAVADVVLWTAVGMFFWLAQSLCHDAIKRMDDQ